MNSELSPPTAYSALPVRRRGTLEILDTALKLYRRYFWVLFGWSALTSAAMLAGSFSPIFSSSSQDASTFSTVLSLLATFFYPFSTPLLSGAVSCCVAAAVRGQSVHFRQCWQFTKPRYWPLVGVIFLSWLLFFVVAIVLYIVAILIGIAGVYVFMHAPQAVQIVAAIVGGIAILVFFSVLGVVVFGWVSMVPVVACLEDDKRGSAAMGRAIDLLKGNWRRVFGLSLIIGLAMFAVFAIVAGVYALFSWDVLKELFGASPSNNALMRVMLTFGAFSSLFFLLWNPAQTLIIAVLYLDLRVRREALDLEWTAYASAPPPSIDALQTPAASFSNSPVGEAPTSLGTDVTPTSLAAGIGAGNFGVSADGAADAPITDLSSVEFPIVEPPVAEQPIAEIPIIQQPTFEQPTVVAPIIEQPVVEPIEQPLVSSFSAEPMPAPPPTRPFNEFKEEDFNANEAGHGA